MRFGPPGLESVPCGAIVSQNIPPMFQKKIILRINLVSGERAIGSAENVKDIILQARRLVTNAEEKNQEAEEDEATAEAGIGGVDDLTHTTEDGGPARGPRVDDTTDGAHHLAAEVIVQAEIGVETGFVLLANAIILQSA